MTSYFYESEGLPKSPNQLSRSWQAVYGESQKWLRKIADATIEAGRPKKPLEHASIVYTRHSAVEPDYDNLVASFKRVQDALIKTGVILNDSPNNLLCEYKWARARYKHGKISIEVTEV